MEKNQSKEMTQEQYRSKTNEVADLAVNYMKTGNGYFSLQKAFNELAEGCGANKGINHESTIGRRKLLASQISINCISRLDSEMNDRLKSQLYVFAEDYEAPSQSRGFHR